MSVDRRKDGGSGKKIRDFAKRRKERRGSVGTMTVRGLRLAALLCSSSLKLFSSSEIPQRYRDHSVVDPTFQKKEKKERRKEKRRCHRGRLTRANRVAVPHLLDGERLVPREPVVVIVVLVRVRPVLIVPLAPLVGIRG